MARASMTAGRLRERLAFEQKVTVPADEYGNTQGSFEEQFTVSAAIEPKLGGEGVAAMRLEGRQPMLITVRHSPDTAQITTDWRARNIRSGAVYNVRTAVDPDGRRQWIEMLCEAGVAA